MKCSVFLLSLIGALALADQTCQCDEPPVCIQSYPESCICAERAKEACWNKCGGPMPRLTGCPPLTTTVPEPEPEESQCLPEPLLCATLHGAMNCECRNAVALNKMRCTKIWLPLEDCSATKPEPQPQPQPRAEDLELESSSAPGCLPEPILCATLHGPRTCECRNAIAMNKMRCTKIFLPMEDCSVPEPEPQPQPRAEDSELASSSVPGCLPEPLLCATLHGPRTCECRNAIAMNKMRCTKIFLTLEDCSAPPSQPGDDTCVCEDTMCVQSWPESCYCENAAIEACFQQCGGEKPELQTCPSLPSQTFATVIKAAPAIQTPASA